MADNLTFSTTTQTGMPNASVVATDDIAGAHYQRVKIIIGANGTNDGDVASGNPMPVTVSGVATAANQSSELTLVGAVTETAPATDTASSGLNGRLQRIAQRLTSLIALLPTALGQATMANSLAVTIASNQSAITANPTFPSTSTVTSVNDTATSTTLLSSNAARLGATLYNTSTVTAYVKFGTTASATSFTIAMAASSYYEVPFGYTGRIDAVWASDQSGAMIINELTA